MDTEPADLFLHANFFVIIGNNFARNDNAAPDRQ